MTVLLTIGERKVKLVRLSSQKTALQFIAVTLALASGHCNHNEKGPNESCRIPGEILQTVSLDVGMTWQTLAGVISNTVRSFENGV